MTNAALARRADFEPIGTVPSNLREIADAAVAPPAPAPGKPAATSGPNTLLQTLTTYIPTEVLTLYVSAMAALSTGAAQKGLWIPFWCFLILTPAFVWVAFATKVKAAGNPIPVSPTKWPFWEMAAAMIAYVAWALALPNSPFSRLSWYSAGIAGFAVLVVSTGLGVVAPLMQRPLPA